MIHIPFMKEFMDTVEVGEAFAFNPVNGESFRYIDEIIRHIEFELNWEIVNMKNRTYQKPKKFRLRSDITRIIKGPYIYERIE